MNSLTIETLILKHLIALPNLDKNKIARLNRNFIPPTDGIWCRVTILGGNNLMSGMADVPCTREIGTLIIQVFDRENNGTASLKRFCDNLAKHLAYYQAENLELLTPSIIHVGEGGGFYQYNVSVPYRYN